MAKRRSAAQKAATAKMIAANKRKHRNPSSAPRKATKRRKTSHNPHHFKVAARRKTRRNPSIFGGGGILGDLISKEGLIMVAAAMVAPMAADYVQQAVMPSATGWTKIAIKVAVIGAGAYALDKFLHQRKAALAFGVTGAAVIASDAIQIARGVMSGLSASEADMVANRPDLVQQIANGYGYKRGMADNRLGEPGDVTGSFNNPFPKAF
jgi:hypothetical protein